MNGLFRLGNTEASQTTAPLAEMFGHPSTSGATRLHVGPQLSLPNPLSNIA
jgi:hypothetical protein